MDYSYVVARDSQLLQEYKRLREACMREAWDAPAGDRGVDDHESAGTVLLAVERGGRVLAGARIYGNHPGQGRRLPVESRQFRLRNFFPSLELASHPYCHWGQVVIDPDVRCKVFARSFLRRLLTCTEALGYRYAFVVADRRRTRYYRHLLRGIGYDYRICNGANPVDDAQADGREYQVSCVLLPIGDSAGAQDRQWRHPGRLQLVGRAGEVTPLRPAEHNAHVSRAPEGS